MNDFAAKKSIHVQLVTQSSPSVVLIDGVTSMGSGADTAVTTYRILSFILVEGKVISEMVFGQPNGAL